MTQIDTLFIDGVRNLKAQEITLSPGLNFFCGHNGAGKTSVLEAVFLLSRGRSFRAHSTRALLQRGSDAALVRARCGEQHMAIERRTGHWSARVDGEDVASLAALSRLLPTVVFHPETHGDFLNEAEQRRRLLDWAVFHVEPAFAETWRAHQRVLKQRNAALASSSPIEARSWDSSLATIGSEMNALRETTFVRLEAAFLRFHRALGGEPRSVVLSWRRGWENEQALMAAIQFAWDRDLALGYSTVGAHRADLILSAHALRAVGTLSRGEGKLAVLALTLAASEVVQECLTAPLLVLLDDIAAEIDSTRFSNLLRLLGGAHYQVLATGVTSPELTDWKRSCSVFHVEQGQISRVL